MTIKQYEVKVYASQDALSKKGNVKSSILKAFNAPDKDEDFLVQFIDHDKKHYREKMTYRIRKSENDDTYELQFKKRYPITTSIEAAVAAAAADGFKDADYEIEYSINKQTLSVTYAAEADADEHLLPDLKTSHEHLKENVHAAFKKHLDMITTPEIVGPITFERHKGKLGGYKIKIEKWDIKDAHIVELSSKVPTEKEAQNVQELLIEKLKALNVYEEKDQLKTDLIFEQY